ncbi:MAG: 6-bladed beta-propeller [Gemmatimonadetes bacterium]|nr:6-bladed beta-propeller [Gemmatimonadota bacterium]
MSKRLQVVVIMEVQRSAAFLAVVALLTGCGGGDRGADRWAGTADTLPSGQVVVRNPATPVWAPEEGWRVTEELRIGSVGGGGPDEFGRIVSFEVDPAGRFWAFDGQAQELRVFDDDGAHVRTIGRRGGGPGEFAQAVQVELGPDGRIWVMDPQNNRISLFDTAGAHVGSHPAMGGFVIMPWPGGFDDRGRYFAPLPIPGEGFRMALVAYDTAFQPVDTLPVLEDPVERDGFEMTNSRGGRIMAGIPFSGGLNWALTPRGTLMGLVTDEYRLFELDTDGDTLRTITREYEPLPVTAADRERARERLEWFTRQGGQIDLSRIPATKPAAGWFFEDDLGNVWVQRIVADEADEGRVHDIFDPDGRFLGTVTLPFPVDRSPAPIVRDGTFYAVTQDSLEVEYLVRARVGSPGAS